MDKSRKISPRRLQRKTQRESPKESLVTSPIKSSLKYRQSLSTKSPEELSPEPVVLASKASPEPSIQLSPGPSKQPSPGSSIQLSPESSKQLSPGPSKQLSVGPSIRFSPGRSEQLSLGSSIQPSPGSTKQLSPAPSIRLSPGSSKQLSPEDLKQRATLLKYTESPRRKRLWTSVDTLESFRKGKVKCKPTTVEYQARQIYYPSTRYIKESDVDLFQLLKNILKLASSPNKSVDMNCDKIFRSVYLGCEKAARNFSYLQSLRITHLVNVTEKLHDYDVLNYCKSQNIIYKGYSLVDNETFDIGPFLLPIAKYITNICKSKSNNVLIYDTHGQGPAVICTAAFLMISKSLSLGSALEYITSLHHCIPQDYLLIQLIILDKELKREKKKDEETKLAEQRRIQEISKERKRLARQIEPAILKEILQPPLSIMEDLKRVLKYFSDQTVTCVQCPPDMNCNQIDDRIYVGCEKTAKNTSFLHSKGIAHVVDLTGDGNKQHQIEYFRQLEFGYYGFQINNSEDFELHKFFTPVVNCIWDIKTSEKGKILIFDADGYGVSSIFATAFYISYLKLSSAEALTMVLQKHSFSPSDRLLQYLLNYDRDIREYVS